MKILLSVHPKYSKLIFSGEKKYELRRRLPGMSHGDVIWVYETSPSQSIVGYFTVKELYCSSLRAIWRRTGKSSCIEKLNFDRYFDNCAQAFAIAIHETVRLDQPIDLPSIRARWRGFTPPQSFRYIPDTFGLPVSQNR